MLDFNSRALRRKSNRVAVGEEISSPTLPLSICNKEERTITVQEREHIKEIMTRRVQRNSIGLNRSRSVRNVSTENSNNNLNKNLVFSDDNNRKDDSCKTNTSTTDSTCE